MEKQIPKVGETWYNNTSKRLCVVADLFTNSRGDNIIKITRDTGTSLRQSLSGFLETHSPTLNNAITPAEKSFALKHRQDYLKEIREELRSRDFIHCHLTVVGDKLEARLEFAHAGRTLWRTPAFTGLNALEAAREARKALTDEVLAMLREAETAWARKLFGQAELETSADRELRAAGRKDRGLYFERTRNTFVLWTSTGAELGTFKVMDLDSHSIRHAFYKKANDAVVRELEKHVKFDPAERAAEDR